ncbi:hypothetical protein [Desulfonatronovibrio hydrogenovorans]|uniref:hypothetical protein n=1 Tax=Desulfonatronovibrio hydrogenovorans TaxID=53245 RepID=UPI00048E6C60|nr:hypothetical protein [Desulfonatronovibrio hydrogenovorans]
MNIQKKMPGIIKKLDKAIEALDLLWELTADSDREDPRDTRIQLRRDLAEYADYLERATWWRQ